MRLKVQALFAFVFVLVSLSILGLGKNVYQDPAINYGAQNYGLYAPTSSPTSWIPIAVDANGNVIISNPGGGGGSSSNVTITGPATPTGAINSFVQSQPNSVTTPIAAINSNTNSLVQATPTVNANVFVVSQPNSVTTPLALLTKVGNSATTATGAAGTGTISTGFQDIFYPVQAITTLGLATPITFGGNSLSNYAAQIDIGTGVTNLTAYLLLSYDGGLSYPSKPVTYSSITASTVATTSQFCGATNMAVSVGAWTLSGTPTVTVYQVAR